MDNKPAYLSLLEAWAPAVYTGIKFTLTEKKVIRQAGRVIAAQIQPGDIADLIGIAGMGLPRNLGQTQMENYVRGVFDAVAAGAHMDDNQPAELLKSVAVNEALQMLKDQTVGPSDNFYNHTGPRLREPGRDWNRS